MTKYDFDFTGLSNNDIKSMSVKPWQAGEIDRLYIAFVSGTAVGPIDVEIYDEATAAIREGRVTRIEGIAKGETTQPYDEVIDLAYDTKGSNTLYAKFLGLTGADNRVKIRIYIVTGE